MALCSSVGDLINTPGELAINERGVSTSYSYRFVLLLFLKKKGARELLHTQIKIGKHTTYELSAHTFGHPKDGREFLVVTASHAQRLEPSGSTSEETAAPAPEGFPVESFGLDENRPKSLGVGGPAADPLAPALEAAESAAAGEARSCFRAPSSARRSSSSRARAATCDSSAGFAAPPLAPPPSPPPPLTSVQANEAWRPLEASSGAPSGAPSFAAPSAPGERLPGGPRWWSAPSSLEPCGGVCGEVCGEACVALLERNSSVTPSSSRRLDARRGGGRFAALGGPVGSVLDLWRR